MVLIRVRVGLRGPIASYNLTVPSAESEEGSMKLIASLGTPPIATGLQNSTSRGSPVRAISKTCSVSWVGVPSTAIVNTVRRPGSLAVKKKFDNLIHNL